MPSSRAQPWLRDSALEEKQAIGQVISNLIPKDWPCLQQSMEKFKPKGPLKSAEGVVKGQGEKWVHELQTQANCRPAGLQEREHWKKPS